MLTPKELLEIAETMQPLLDELNAWITQDLIERLMAQLSRNKSISITGFNSWQIQVYQEAGGHLEALQKKIAEFIKKSDAEVKAIFEDAGIRAYESDALFFDEQGIVLPPLRQSKHMLDILEDTYARTNGEIHNFTRTTANQSQIQLIKALDAAHFKVYTGAQSYAAATMEAVEELSKYQAEVKYPTGHIDTLETAVLRAVRTGTAQAAGNMSQAVMDENGWDIVLTSAHIGARYGDGGENPTNHFWWQGKFYSLRGKTPGLPDFVECTGYGTGEGLCGWNCRHSFGPGDGEHNPYEGFDSEENKKAYDLSQKQRQMERSIRRTKQRLVALSTAINNADSEDVRANLQNAYDKLAVRLQQQNKKYEAFCASNNLKRQYDRMMIAQWTREENKRATAGARRRLSK